MLKSTVPEAMDAGKKYYYIDTDCNVHIIEVSLRRSEGYPGGELYAKVPDLLYRPLTDLKGKFYKYNPKLYSEIVQKALIEANNKKFLAEEISSKWRTRAMYLEQILYQLQKMQKVTARKKGKLNQKRRRKA
ncbi:MAG: hypothetical protein WC471_03185 [Candidatus Woesearchaeota archaeon]